MVKKLSPKTKQLEDDGEITKRKLHELLDKAWTIRGKENQKGGRQWASGGIQLKSLNVCSD